MDLKKVEKIASKYLIEKGLTPKIENQEIYEGAPDRWITCEECSNEAFIDIYASGEVTISLHIDEDSTPEQADVFYEMYKQLVKEKDNENN